MTNALLAILLLSSAAAFAEDLPYPGPVFPALDPECSREIYSTFLAQLRAANDPDALARLVIFPLRINKLPKAFIITSRAELKRRFHEAFSKKVLQAIELQEESGMLCNYHGLALADGAVWVHEANNRVGIFALNP